MNEKVDYIVIGQGLAGTLVCCLLEELGRSFIVFDQGHQGTSSSIAAGIINPITGRRFVKSWMYDDLLPIAINRYQVMEKKLNIKLLRPQNILRYLHDTKAENDWLSKSAHPSYRKYILAEPRLDTRGILNLSGRWGEVTRSYQLDIPLLISNYRDHLKEKSKLREQRFDIELFMNRIAVQEIYGIQFEKAIFCEGHLMCNNALFAGSFLNPSKGEILLIRIPGFETLQNVKKKFFLVPWREDYFWFGAKDGWQFEDPHPSELGHELLIKHARELINVEFEILAHKAAIRPTIKDRRPVIGRHPQYENIYLFNGLGTKGASLGPYWAQRLVANIELGDHLPKEVNVARF